MLALVIAELHFSTSYFPTVIQDIRKASETLMWTITLVSVQKMSLLGKKRTPDKLFNIIAVFDG